MHNKYNRTNEHSPNNLRVFNMNTIQDNDVLFQTSVRTPTLIIDLISEPLVGTEG